MKKKLVASIQELMDAHIETWGTVDEAASDDDAVVLRAARRGMELNRIRSNSVEAIDELLLKSISLGNEYENHR